MSHVTFNRKRVKLKKLVGIRARLALLAVILVAPLMLERARSLEDTRAKQIAAVSIELSNLARSSADAQREVISSSQTMLKSAAYIRASTGGVGHSCDLLRASLPMQLPWVRSLLIVGKDGRVQCSTNTKLVGLDLNDRPALRKARDTRDFAFSDFLFSKSDNHPILMAAYPVSAINADSDSVIVAAVNLDWMSKIMGNLGSRPGISALLVDRNGTVLAAPAHEIGMVGRGLDTIPMLSPIAKEAMTTNRETESFSFVGADGATRTVSVASIAGTGSRLIVSIDETTISASINREILTAYLQLGLVCLFVLLGALIAAEKIIVQPIEMMAAAAKRFGQGDRTARALCHRLPAEFIPLARAFNAMAAQLGERERELIAANDQLTVIASIDMLSGLANRRGFQSRLEFEWMKSMQHDGQLSLLMIDVDHFKLFNDTYGHPEGDSCLSRIGETLSGIAAECMGFAGRYGGEEFCLLLPNIDAAGATAIGEAARAAVYNLAIPNCASNHHTVTVSVGVACTSPNDTQQSSDLIEAADAALYAAKHRGRNTVAEHGFARSVRETNPLAMAS
jgi:diguanylate cyclase (GGDEF)-like protein